MKVLYDYQGLIQKIGGVSRYHTELIRHLRQMGVDCQVPFLISDNLYLDGIGVRHKKPLDWWKSEFKENIYKWLNQKIDLRHIKKEDYDILHPTFCNPYFIDKTMKPVVITIHDLNYSKYPNLTVKSDVVTKKIAMVCKRADSIIVISNETKLDLIKYHHVPEEKITVVYHGSDQDLISCDKNPIYERPYILYVGGRNGYKNFSTFLKGFSLLKEDIHLVCSGKPFNQSELQLINRLGIREKVYQKFVSDDDLNNLFCHAKAFAYPSLAEGFGLPILEAFRCSCPCFVSDIMCFHEVAGDAASYFNPVEPDDIAMVLKTGLSDYNSLKTLRQRGLIQLKKFTWDRTAYETKKVYSKLL